MHERKEHLTIQDLRDFATMIANFFSADSTKSLPDLIKEFKEVFEYWYDIPQAKFEETIKNMLFAEYVIPNSKSHHPDFDDVQNLDANVDIDFDNMLVLDVSVDSDWTSDSYQSLNSSAEVQNGNDLKGSYLISIILATKIDSLAIPFLLTYVDRIEQVSPGTYGGQILYFMAKFGASSTVLESLLKYPNLYINIRNRNGDTPLHHAIKNGNVECVKKFLEYPNIDPNVLNNEESTPLDIAINLQDQESAFLLLEHDEINPNLADYRGDIPAVNALQKNTIEIFKRIIHHKKIDINAVNQNAGYLFKFALNYKLHDAIKSMLKIPKLDVNALDQDGNTPLYRVILLQDTTILQLLLAHPKMNVNTPNKKIIVPIGFNIHQKRQCKFISETPLHLACKNYMHNTIALLLQNGADARLLNSQNKSPVEILINNTSASNDFELNYLIETIAMCPMILNKFDSALTFMQEILRCSFKTGEWSIALDSIIEYAYKTEYIQYNKRLIENPNRFIKQWMSVTMPLAIHALCNMESVGEGSIAQALKYLISNSKVFFVNAEEYSEFQLSIESKDCDGFTPLRIAFEKRSKLFIEIFINAGANINVEVQRKTSAIIQTPLHFVCDWCNYNLVKFMLEKEANVDAKNSNNLTALQIVMDKFASLPTYHSTFYRDGRHLDMALIILELIKYGADPNFPLQNNSELFYPLHYSCSTHNFTLTKFLLASTKIDLSVRDLNGNTPLNIASAINDAPIKELLSKHKESCKDIGSV